MKTYETTAVQYYYIQCMIACVCVFVSNCKSPISMKVTMRLLNEGADLTLAQELKTEFRLCQRFIRESDFYEGVRAG